MLRSLDEISTRDELTSTGYGRGVLVKSALLLAIAGLAAANRWRNVRLAQTHLRPLRRAAGGEVGLAAAALVAAATLAGLSPPAAQGASAVSGLSATGHDFATTVEVELTTAVAQPGPNQFTVGITDFDTGERVRGDRVSLRFTAIDDPDVASTTLALGPSGAGTHTALGNDLAFQGRWKIDVLIEDAARSTLVPLTVETVSPLPFVSITRAPGEPPIYTVVLVDERLAHFVVDPEREGSNDVRITFADVLGVDLPIRDLVVTSTDRDGTTLVARSSRVSDGGFTAEVELTEGRNRVVAIARHDDGTRYWAAFEIDL